MIPPNGIDIVLLVKLPLVNVNTSGVVDFNKLVTVTLSLEYVNV